MSPTLLFDPSTALRLDSAGGDVAGFSSTELASLAGKLDKARDELCDLDEKMLAGEIAIPASRLPLLGAFARLPQQLLTEYEADRPASQLGRMLAVTKQLMTEVDRVVVLGERGWLAGPHALMQACCQPHFNELSRGQRGSRPRILFLSDSLDNDEVQGALHLIGAHHGRAADNVNERWGLVVLGDSCEQSAASHLVALLMSALEVNCDGNLLQARNRAIIVAKEASPLRLLARELSFAHEFSIPTAMSASYSVLSMVGLLPAALLGINVMKLLEGARTVYDHFRVAKASVNPVLQYAAVNHLSEKTTRSSQRDWLLWSQRLQATAAWYRNLIAGSLGLTLQIETAPTLYPPAPHLTDAAKPRLIHQVATARFRFDPLTLSDALRQDTADLNTSPNLVNLLQAEREKWQQRYVHSGRPFTRLTLPQVDEPCIGQLMQWLMLATVVEARMSGGNPYGE